MIYHEEFETLPREALEALQLKRLKTVVQRVYATVPFYKKKYDEINFKPEQIRSLDDLRRLPLTMKDDLRDNYPFNMFAVPMSSVVRIHVSSGTTGKPTVVGYTARDINLWSDLIARTLMAAGATRSDIVQNAYGYGLFTGGLGFHYGSERLGASVIPVSGGNTKRQIMLMQDFGSTVLTCTPSYALYLAEAAKEMGIDIKKLPLRVGILGAEPWTERMRDEIERRMGIDALDIYGLSEIIGPGVSIECIEGKNGLHIFEDHFLPEIIDPKTGKVLKEGEEGELVLTTLTREGTSLVRYRTGDITQINYQPCDCGRTIARINKIKGRVDDMLIIRGVNIFPSQIENVLLQIEEAEPHYQLILERKRGLDELTVELEVSPNTFFDEVKRVEKIEAKIEKEIEDALGLRIGVRLVESRTIERSMGKAERIIDKRKSK